MIKFRYLILCSFCLINFHFIFVSSALPDAGKLSFVWNGINEAVSIRKSLFRYSKVFLKVTCDESKEENNKIVIQWGVSSVVCWDTGTSEESKGYVAKILKNYTIEEKTSQCDCFNHSPVQCELDGAYQFLMDETTKSSVSAMGPFANPVDEGDDVEKKRKKRKVIGETKSSAIQAVMSQSSQIQSKDKTANTLGDVKTPTKQYLPSLHAKHKNPPIFITPEDSYYTLSIEIFSTNKSIPFSVKVDVEMMGEHGYLSAADWPLLPFYGAMCLVYLVMGLAWLIVSFLQWRDLLRIQFWIGAVILLGMLEKAMFYAEYQNINSTGEPVPGALFLAELVSCGKRTLARMLVIIVSLGFGIVKPRLGAMLHRVIGVGLLYFFLAASVAYIQIMKTKSDRTNPLMIANIPVAVLDSAICWWIFTSLVQTTRTLRLRRNVVKLSIYKHFTTTLIFAVFSSIFFMLYSMRFHHFSLCTSVWNEFWIDEAYWRLLFSVILLVIMILWRPTNNNQRYAFTPLLDAPEDDDEEEEQFFNNAFGVKMRTTPSSGNNSPKQKLSTNSAEEDLKWVEENIPSSLADTALPILDSDEEIMNTRFEISKMQ